MFRLKKQQGVMRRMTPPSSLHHAPADDGRSRLSSAFVFVAPPSPTDSRRHTTTQTMCPKFMPTLHVTDSHLLVATQALDTGTHLMPTTQVFNAHLLPTTQAPNTNLPSIRRSWSMYHVENQELATALLPLHHHPLKASKYGFRTVPHRRLTKIYDNYEEMFPDPTKPPPPKSFSEC
ncbi:hypothetical protein Hamer_G012987 [Homarus americanus]|uniref:Uncharacterized protein n=1 Tax=Homarus americanus TaxID=6706 RepID=A0A8J5K1A4_HOMAM|nr:hypothetical protein Hamer_G012987 [Homarus americanus]